MALGIVALGLQPLQASEVSGRERPEPRTAHVRPVEQRSGASQTIRVTIPLVAFQARVRENDGRIRTAVLVNVSAKPGIVSLDGSTCQVSATPGQVAWLDCPSTRAASYRVTVRLDDGRVFRSPRLPAQR
jgi:hypothetical protein